METLDLIKERLKRGYYTAALDDLRELLNRDPNDKNALKLMEAAVKKYVWYTKKYVNRRLDNLEKEIKQNNFLKSQTIRRFKVTDEVIRNAIKLCKKMHEKTFSDDESKYPCTCGGWCEKDFIGKNGGC